jgi:hypothetical protein
MGWEAKRRAAGRILEGSGGRGGGFFDEGSRKNAFLSRRARRNRKTRRCLRLMLALK